MVDYRGRHQTPALKLPARLSISRTNPGISIIILYMRPAILLAVILVSLMYPCCVLAEEAQPLTLKDCVNSTLDKNHSLLAEGCRLDAAKAGIGKAGAAFMPKLDVTETFMRSDNPVMAFGSKLNQGVFTAADFAVDRLNDPGAVDNFNFSLQATMPIFNGGREWVGLSMAKAGLKAEDKKYGRARQETVFNAVRAYYGVALAGEYVKAAEKSKDATAGHLRVAQSLYGQGMLTGSDVLLAKVRLAEVKETLIKAANRQAIAKAALNVIMARPQDADFQAVDRLSEAVFTGALKDFMEEARANRPDLAATGLGVDMADKGVRMAKTGYLPNVNIVGRYDLDDKDFIGGSGDSYTVMGVVSWNLFDGLLTTSNVSEARANRNMAMHRLDQAKEDVEFEVRQAFYNMQEARQRIETAGAAVEEGEEALRIIQKRFGAGMSKTTDLLDAEAALVRARTNRLSALYDYNVAIAALKLAVGRDAF